MIEPDIVDTLTSVDWERLRRCLDGFYYEGMTLDDLAHALRTRSTSFILLLAPFAKKSEDGKKILNQITK